MASQRFALSYSLSSLHSIEHTRDSRHVECEINLCDADGDAMYLNDRYASYQLRHAPSHEYIAFISLSTCMLECVSALCLLHVYILMLTKS